MEKNDIEKFDENVIRDRIYSIRGFQVMLDRDLAELYGVQTKILNKAVKRNSARFPAEFMMQLSQTEYDSILNLRFHFGTSSWGGTRYLPNVFTEQGVAMLAGILTSETAVIISVKIMKAFVEMRKFILTKEQLFQRVDNLEEDYFIITPLLWRLRREIDIRIEPVLIEKERDDSGFLKGITEHGIEI